MKPVSPQRAVVILIGAIFLLMGFIATLISIPHFSIAGILGGIAAIAGGTGAILKLGGSYYFLYACSTLYAFAGLRNSVALLSTNGISFFSGDTVVIFGSEVLLYCALFLASYIVSCDVTTDEGAT